MQNAGANNPSTSNQQSGGGLSDLLGGAGKNGLGSLLTGATGGALAAGAMEALDRGDLAAHDQAVVAAAQQLAQAGCTAIALAQFSMARAAPLVRNALLGSLPVLTTPESAVRALRTRLAV